MKEHYKNQKKEALEKKLVCNFIRIYTRIKKAIMHTMKPGRVQTFISNFKNRELKELEKESNKNIKNQKTK